MFTKEGIMWTKFRHKITFKILRPFLALFLYFKYGYKSAKFKCNVKKPYLILSNHVTALDPFMVAVSFKMPIYYVASDDIFSLKYLSPIIKFLVAPIPKSKSSSDLQTIKDCYKVSKEGGTICVFPEGNRNYNGLTSFIPFSIVKFVKMLKMTLLLYKIEGGYGVQPRWAGNIRRGKMFGSTQRVLEYENYKNMTEDDLYKYICDNLYVNAFYQLETCNEYKSNKKAEYIERFLYACPDCNSFSTLNSQKNDIICTKCGLKVEYGENLQLKTLSGKCSFINVKEWDDFQKEKIKAFNIDSTGTEKTIFTDDVIWLRQNIRCIRKIDLGKGNMTLCKDRLAIVTNNNYLFYIKDISSIGIFGKNRLLIYHKDEIFQIIGQTTFNALKYQNMIYHIKNTSDGVTDEFLGL